MSLTTDVLKERALANEFSKDSIKRALKLFSEMVEEEGPPAGMERWEVDMAIMEAYVSLTEL
jgi:hypothetical protein